jgi:hypothetical protein
MGKRKAATSKRLMNIKRNQQQPDPSSESSSDDEPPTIVDGTDYGSESDGDSDRAADESSDSEVEPNVSISASERKLSSKASTSAASEIRPQDLPLDGFRLIDIDILQISLNKFAACQNCKAKNSLVLSEKDHKGLSTQLVITCNNKKCNFTYSFHTSKQRESDGTREVNLRFVYAMRNIGNGRAGGEKFCCLMNMPQPPQNFDNYTGDILQATKELAEKSMKDAAAEAAEQSGSDRIPVSADGSFMRRGFSSLFGFSSVISLDTGKVVDIESRSKYCQVCTSRSHLDPKSQEYAEFMAEHQPNCKVNYEGPSGGIEVATVVEIFQRSHQDRGVRYSHYLGDGDSKGHKAVVEADPYKDVGLKVEKLECINHVEKRMGTRLRKLVNDHRTTKCPDGKPLSGKGRLSNQEITNLQGYYGQAIRSTSNTNVNTMHRACWAAFYHKASTDANPHHPFCPPHTEQNPSWCGYKRSQVTGEQYTHKHPLPQVVLNAMRKIYTDLTRPDLLKKCLSGKSQNNNESLNSLPWKEVPKTTFCGKETFQIALFNSVLQFNGGFSAKTKVLLKLLGRDPGIHCTLVASKIDRRRISKAKVKQRESTKEVRRVHRLKRSAESRNDPNYGAGKH